MVKYFARNVIFPITIWTGFEKQFSKHSKTKYLNLMYHGVVNRDSTDFFPRHITAEEFEKQLVYFKNNFEIISPHQAFENILNYRETKKPCISISFDDGYLNNKTVALPLLEKYQIPATFFISSVCSRPANDHIFWSDVVAFSRAFSKENWIEIKGIKFFKKKKYDLIDIKTGISAYSYLKKMKVTERDEAIIDLKTRYEIREKLELLPFEFWKLMDHQQLKKFSSHPLVNIGSHGHRHFNLGQIEPKDALFEMQHSKNQLEKTIGKSVDYFAFPDGCYNDNVLEIGRKIGYKGFFGVAPVNNQRPDDLLFRHGISATTTTSSNLFFVQKKFLTNTFEKF
jgi:peptidoglycan/xylan/chitin deacetylase (PgdA/CDA1 family)